MDRISPNLVYAFILTVKIGIATCYFCVFVTELWPLVV